MVGRRRNNFDTFLAMNPKYVRKRSNIAVSIPETTAMHGAQTVLALNDP
jgi:hypothetical protein